MEEIGDRCNQVSRGFSRWTMFGSRCVSLASKEGSSFDQDSSDARDEKQFFLEENGSCGGETTEIVLYIPLVGGFMSQMEFVFIFLHN